MSDQNNVLELINAEIDGVITGAQRAELNRLLLADPVIRAQRDVMTRACCALDAMPREDLPAGLHDAILAGLPVGAPRFPAARRTAAAIRPLFRYAAAFAGGLLVSALALQLGKLDSMQVGASDTAGTLAAAATHAEARMIVNLPQAQGVIILSGSAAAPQVVTSLIASQPVSIVTELHQDGAVDVQVVDDATAVVLQRGKLRIGSER